jgi:hypothetical protein
MGMLLALSAAPAQAVPVYLRCVVSQGQPIGDVDWEITLNEETGMVTWTIPMMNVAERARAIFNANEVRWNTGMSLFTINRRTLAFVRSSNLGPPPPMITNGRCQRQAQGRRAF